MPILEHVAGRTGTQNQAVSIAPVSPSYRVPPHNIEAEQALLGAILVNNDAFDRVSDFLKAAHFSEDLHRRIYDVASQLIRAGKLATPVTLKTFLGDHDLGGVTIPQYLARLAAEATTIINAEDYGRTIHDLAVRRDLILIGEDIVNAAFEPSDAERSWAEKVVAAFAENPNLGTLRLDGKMIDKPHLRAAKRILGLQ